MSIPGASILGARVLRSEDAGFLTTGGQYMDDLVAEDALYAVFVRSVVAHGEVLGIETADAAAMPGVVGVYTAGDLGIVAKPPTRAMLNQGMLRSWLASDRVRYVGEPIAVVVAQTLVQATDAAEQVWADIEPLPAVVSALESAKDELLLFPDAGTNTVYELPASGEDVFAGCEVTVTQSFRNTRLAPAPMEPRGGMARWDVVDGREKLTHWSVNQGSHRARGGLMSALGLDADQVRVITPDVGGSFGAKNGNDPEDLVIAVVARHMDRQVRWVETRSESMMGLLHGRAQDITATIGGTRDGRVLGFRSHITQDSGAHAEIGAWLPTFARNLAPGPYDIANVDVHTVSVVTNTMPVGGYRGAGRPEATQIIERMMDVFAAEIAMDPAEVRRRNFVQPDAFPYTNAMGTTMDSGNYEGALDAVLEAVDYAGLRAEQARRRNDPNAKLLGLGWSSYIEITNPGSQGEFGSIEVRPDGTAEMLIGVSSQGQGHKTVFAQIASGLTGIPVDMIVVREGDSDLIPRSHGTGGSRGLQTCGSAVKIASEAMIEEAKSVAAKLLEANWDDIVLDVGSGVFSVAGTPAITRSWSDIAAATIEETGERFYFEGDFKPDGEAYPSGTHLSIVEIDRDTGQVTPIRHVACDDCGIIMNPMLVEGQVHGGIASGIAQGLMEEFVYDDEGNPNTANFMDYAILSATELPNFERLVIETPSPLNPLGAKGVGESGTIGGLAAFQNAVVDALAHLGVRHVEIPTTPERVWRAMTEAARS